MKYTCDNHRPIPADDHTRMSDAAYEFAGRKARSEFGRRGYCRHINMDGWAGDGSFAEFEAFIGVPGAESGETVGHNVRFTVYADE